MRTRAHARSIHTRSNFFCAAVFHAQVPQKKSISGGRRLEPELEARIFTHRRTHMKLTNIVSRLALATVALAFVMSAGAQTIHQRKENQQDRIANGVKNGSLTPRETSHLENREANLNRTIRTDRKGDDGHLTPGEKASINNRQNRISRGIYRDKHNAARQG
jgi:hypothetical protein